MFFVFFQYHETKCQFILINCPNDKCNIKVQRGLKESHIKERCIYRQIQCEHCEEIVVRKDLEV